MAFPDADRPDPIRNREASQHYADYWARSHAGPRDELAYRVGYADLLTLDAMLTGYRLLDVGCGTGGYLHLARNAVEIVGLDYSETMIAKARESVVPRATFQCCRYEDFISDQPFDVVRLGGVVGWYAPWPGNEAMLRRARKLLSSGGIVIASYVPPRGLVQWVKALSLPRRTVLIPAHKFLAMARACGLHHLFSIVGEYSYHAFLRSME